MHNVLNWPRKASIILLWCVTAGLRIMNLLSQTLVTVVTRLCLAMHTRSHGEGADDCRIREFHWLFPQVWNWTRVPHVHPWQAPSRMACWRIPRTPGTLLLWCRCWQGRQTVRCCPNLSSWCKSIFNDDVGIWPRACCVPLQCMSLRWSQGVRQFVGNELL